MQRRTSILLSVALLATLLAGVSRANAQQQSCFAQTGHCIRGRFAQYWQQNGGLTVFGYPLTDELTEQGRTVQYFERQRFELHAENVPPYDVLLGLLGEEVLQQHGIDWHTQPISPGPVATCLWFEQTQHNLCDQTPGSGFKQYWTTHGLEFDGRPGKSYQESLALFGLPITEPFQDTIEGQTFQVQWFERARFEWHPNNPAPYKVLLGRLGAEVLAGPPPANTDVAPAVQVVLDYYTAINARAYDRAYQLWANGGAASGQTLDQFRQGFSQTVQVDLLLGAPQGPDSAGRVAVPVNLAAVVNDPSVPDLGQRVQQFRGTYSVAPGAGGWQLAGASIAEIHGALPPAALRAPDVVVRSYYEAITRHDIASAYTFWEQLGQASGQTFAQFAQGYANTASATVELGQIQSDAGAGNIYADVPVVIYATLRDGTPQTFCGTYTVHSANIPPFNALGWHISRASIIRTADVAPGSDQAKRLLNGGCMP